LYTIFLGISFFFLMNVLLRTEIAFFIQLVDLLFPIWESSVKEGPVRPWTAAIFQIVTFLAFIVFQ
jgi:hypothetical protein